MEGLIIVKSDLLLDRKTYYKIVFDRCLKDKVMNSLNLMISEKSETGLVLSMGSPEIEYSFSRKLYLDFEYKFKKLNIYDEDSQGLLLLKIVQSIDKSLIKYSN